MVVMLAEDMSHSAMTSTTGLAAPPYPAKRRGWGNIAVSH
jgi:hypothetical protein